MTSNPPDLQADGQVCTEYMQACRCTAQVEAHHQETSDDQLLKLLEGRRVLPRPWVQDLRHLMAQLEGRRLEPQVASRADLQYESKVNVHQVPLISDHDVAVVPVLALQQVACDRIPARHTMRFASTTKVLANVSPKHYRISQ